MWDRLTVVETSINPIEMNQINLISPKQVTERLSIPQSTLYRWIAAGKFPRPIKIGPRRTAFKVLDIEEWLEKKSRADAQVEVT